MRNSTRAGFTMTEMLIVMVLLGIVGAVLTRNMLSMQRSARDQAERANMQSSVRAGMALVPAELRDLNIGGTGTDLLVAGATSVEYRAMRSTGIACISIAGTNTITLRDRLTFGYRAIQAGPRDSIFVFVEGDANTSADDNWARLGITAKVPGVCPNGDLATELTLSGNLPAGVPTGAPVRTYERMELSLYTSGGRWWLGARSVSATEAVQPVLGPLSANGLAFLYYDAVGATTATLANVRSIVIAMKGETQGAVSRGTGSPRIASDSVFARIRLRNTP